MATEIDNERRSLLAKSVAGISVGAVWHSPVVMSVVTPAHAQSTAGPAGSVPLCLTGSWRFTITVTEVWDYIDGTTVLDPPRIHEVTLELTAEEIDAGVISRSSEFSESETYEIESRACNAMSGAFSTLTDFRFGSFGTWAAIPV